MSCRTAFLWGVVGATATATVSPALARDLVDLTWEAPAACPQAVEVQERIRTIVGKAPKSSAHLDVQGRITRQGRRYRLALTVYDSGVRRERTIESDSCADLAGAAAVALGLLLKEAAATGPQTGSETRGETGSEASGAVDQPADREPVPATAPPPATRTPKIKRAPRSKPARPETGELDEPGDAPSSADAPENNEWRALLRAPVFGIDVGQLPTSAMSWGAGLGIRYGSWHAAVVGRMFKGQTLWASSFPEVGSQVDHVAAELWLCRALPAAPFEFSPCLTLAYDRFAAEGAGARVTAQPEKFGLFSPGAAVLAHLPLFDWLALFAWGGASISGSRPTFQVEIIAQQDDPALNPVLSFGQLGPARGSFGIGSEWSF